MREASQKRSLPGPDITPSAAELRTVAQWLIDQAERIERDATPTRAEAIAAVAASLPAGADLASRVFVALAAGPCREGHNPAVDAALTAAARCAGGRFTMREVILTLSPQEEWLSPRDVATMLRISLRSAQRLIQHRAVRVGRVLRIRAADLKALVSQDWRS